ncbi:MAG: hypothetical protein HY791_07605 [Deltaproteobacteria bacterium]|nr:hypothetical protein [Deltaproteobacteria bacterium]
MSRKSKEVANLEAALDMFDFGVDMMFERLRREYPSESRRQLEERLNAWLRDRPGAERGDVDDGTWPDRS